MRVLMSGGEEKEGSASLEELLSVGCREVEGNAKLEILESWPRIWKLEGQLQLQSFPTFKHD